MKTRELRQLTREELEQKESDSVEELFNLRFQQVTGKLENPSRMKEVRRTIARIKTIQKQFSVLCSSAAAKDEKVESKKFKVENFHHR